MKTFQQLMEEVKMPKKGDTVSFTHSTSGKVITGTYRGQRAKDGHSYAVVDTDKETHWVPNKDLH